MYNRVDEETVRGSVDSRWREVRWKGYSRWRGYSKVEDTVGRRDTVRWRIQWGGGIQ